MLPKATKGFSHSTFYTTCVCPFMAFTQTSISDQNVYVVTLNNLFGNVFICKISTVIVLPLVPTRGSTLLRFPPSLPQCVAMSFHRLAPPLPVKTTWRHVSSSVTLYVVIRDSFSHLQTLCSLSTPSVC